MDPSPAHVDSSTPYYGNDKVTFGNGIILPISHVGITSISPKLILRDVLVVANLRM